MNLTGNLLQKASLPDLRERRRDKPIEVAKALLMLGAIAAAVTLGRIFSLALLWWLGWLSLLFCWPVILAMIWGAAIGWSPARSGGAGSEDAPETGDHRFYGHLPYDSVSDG